MNSLINLLLADAPLTDPPALDRPLNPVPQDDPLIDTTGQYTVFFGAVLLAIGLVVLVRIFSPRVEHTLIAASVLSLGLIVLFLSFGH